MTILGAGSLDGLIDLSTEIAAYDDCFERYLKASIATADDAKGPTASLARFLAYKRS